MAAQSLWPNSLKQAAISHRNSGGLSSRIIPEKRGVTQSPVATIWRAFSA